MTDTPFRGHPLPLMIVDDPVDQIPDPNQTGATGIFAPRPIVATDRLAAELREARRLLDTHRGL